MNSIITLLIYNLFYFTLIFVPMKTLFCTKRRQRCPMSLEGHIFSDLLDSLLKQQREGSCTESYFRPRPPIWAHLYLQKPFLLASSANSLGIQIRFKYAVDIFGEDRIWLLFPSWLLVASALSLCPSAMPRIRPKGLPRGGFPVSKDNVVRVPLANVLSWDQLVLNFWSPKNMLKRKLLELLGIWKISSWLVWLPINLQSYLVSKTCREIHLEVRMSNNVSSRIF